MKNKLFALFFLFVLLSACERKTEILVAQTVPDTETFSLFDVLDAVYGSHASGNLSDAFAFSDAAKFDPNYGSKDMNPQTLLGFRNYGAFGSPVATAATYVSCTKFTSNWGTVGNATGYYLDVSIYSDFTTNISGYNNLDVGNVITDNVTGLNNDYTYYYRVRAYKTGSTSGNSNIITVTLTTSFDWFVPSEPALKEMYDNLFLNNIGSFSSNRVYWSSTSCSPSAHYATNFADRVSYCRNDPNEYYIRAARNFQTTNAYNIGDIGPAGGWIYHKGDMGGGVYDYGECASEDEPGTHTWAGYYWPCQ